MDQPEKNEKDKDEGACKETDFNVENEEVLEEEQQKLEDELPSTEELNNEIIFLKKELENYKDLYLRLNAEFENFKRRTLKEKSQIYDKSKSDCVAGFLEVLDNLERALDLVKTKDKFSEGINLVVTKFYDVLKGVGVVEIESLGKVFNPEYHQAIKVIEDEKYDKNVVCEVFKKGFILNDVVIRHAFVVVANPNN